MRRQLFFLCSLFSVIYYLFSTSPVFAQDATAPLDGATSPAGRRRGREQRTENREQKLEERKVKIQARRTEKQKQIVERMKQKLAAVIDRLNNVVVRLKNHVARIRALSKGNEKVEFSLSEAEKHIMLAETEINNVKSKLAELEDTDKPRGVAQTFRTGVRSIHSHFKDARANLVAALKSLREAAKESRPTGTNE